ncbi:MAG: GAF domain-containing protein [Thermoanaerobaculia bacterium]
MSSEETRVILRHIIRGGGERSGTAQRLAEALRAAGGYRWLGLYDVGPEEIAAVAWSGGGEPAFPRFPRTQGLCGSAASSGATVLVPDVRRDPRYLTTFGNTLSEMIVPVRDPVTGRVAGLIDVESDRAGAFTEDDRAFFEECAADLADFWRTGS